MTQLQVIEDGQAIGVAYSSLWGGWLVNSPYCRDKGDGLQLSAFGHWEVKPWETKELAIDAILTAYYAARPTLVT
ncbi:hypothetical protein [Thermoleptolyngbya sp. M55_K2018_002]|uniref:hypothetical protein n=1 Tax=Thermoleptolyngbya sp. M55_K2018_002 TaxID=2747808 RepID=UPI001A0B8ED3|nr:hypothetical protein [Thermoleptolyngbya sp. M55_K2018_002]HIK40408.1 hypothetical protein [Thermoleptolyngbya sp. M55_K2018_002]